MLSFVRPGTLEHQGLPIRRPGVGSCWGFRFQQQLRFPAAVRGDPRYSALVAHDGGISDPPAIGRPNRKDVHALKRQARARMALELEGPDILIFAVVDAVGDARSVGREAPRAPVL